ncbi:MAG: HAD family hydrolase, partial [Acidobacteriaceae bacterium]
RVSEAIRLVLSDVDGTLVTPEKVLTPEAIDAVRGLHERGILFALTSSRPPRGMTMLVEPLQLTTPLSGFNGGQIVDRDLQILHERTIDDEIVPKVLEILTAHRLSAWVYHGLDWFVLDLSGPRVAHESAVTQFEPTVVKNFDAVRSGVLKIVGVSDDALAVAYANDAIERQFAGAVSATRSQSYYLDVTHPDANKGVVVDFLAHRFKLERSEILVIGDMANDVPMFARAGHSVAMGNATRTVKRRAKKTTSSNDDNGFAAAIVKFVLDVKD